MRLFLTSILIFFISSCVSIIPFGIEETKYPDYFDLPLNKMEGEYRTFSLEKQYQIYLDGLNMHPPYLFHANIIAEKGKGAVAFLLEKHKSAKNTDEKFAIAKIFEIMEDNGYYHPTKEEERIV